LEQVNVSNFLECGWIQN